MRILVPNPNTSGGPPNPRWHWPISTALGLTP